VIRVLYTRKTAMKKTAKKPEVGQAKVQVKLPIARPTELKGMLLELVIASGMEVVQVMLEEDREQLCGPRYARSEGRKAHRYGYPAGELALGGRRIHVQRSRMRTKESQEAELPTWQRLTSEDPLTERRRANDRGRDDPEVPPSVSTTSGTSPSRSKDVETRSITTPRSFQRTRNPILKAIKGCDRK
jgi:hypothetical protein